MLKITDQYFWNFVLLVFLGVLVVMGAIILDTEARIQFSDLGLFDIALITLGSWRLTRFLSSDTTTKFLREQLYDLKKTTKSYSLEVPKTGPRRTLLEIILSPWNLSLGITALVTFCYLLSAFTIYPLILLSISGLVSLLQISTEFLEKKVEAE
jgi:hypothetical protein